MLHAALAAKWLEPPKDALDTLVLNAADLAACDAYVRATTTGALPHTIHRRVRLRQAPLF